MMILYIKNTGRGIKAMIKAMKTVKGPKIIFRGSSDELQKDLTRIIWSMIQKDDSTRRAVVNAIEEINQAVKLINE